MEYGKIRTDLGKKIRRLRDKEGLSQDELARMAGIPRPSLSQIESGKRSVSAEELIDFSRIFRVSLDILTGAANEAEISFVKDKSSTYQAETIRINVPQRNLRKFKEVLLYILTKAGGKPNVGETVIYKLLYFIDFNYYERHEEQLVGATYIKNIHGPTPLEFGKIAEGMIRDNEIQKVRTRFHGLQQTKYLALRGPDLTVLNARELQTIDDVIAKLSDMTAQQISDFSHADIPWLSTPDGRPIDYETVFYRTKQYSTREYDDEVQ